MTYLHTIDPVALHLGPVDIHWYGLTYLLGFGAGWWLGARRLRQGRLGVSEAAFADLMFYAMLGVILGGRLGYMLFYGTDAWTKDPLALLRIWEGGMSFHGGLLGVLIAGWWWNRRHRIAFWDTVDFLVPLIPPGLGFVRIGNFVGGELYGKETGTGWGVIFPSSLPDPYSTMSTEQLTAAWQAGQLDVFARHPSQLYEAGLEGLVLFAVLWWFTTRPRPRYAASGVFALLYGLFRFAVEFVRVPDQHIGYLAFDWLTMGQVLTLPLIVLGLVLLTLAYRRRPIAVN
jgi:phosphatidylglycerol:prolipoprotein diacylglycerol transferase